MRFVPDADRGRPLHALLGALLIAAFAALFAVPSPAHADEPSNAPLPLINKTEEVGPGITLHHVKSLGESGWQDEQVLTVHPTQIARVMGILSTDEQEQLDRLLVRVAEHIAVLADGAGD